MLKYIEMLVSILLLPVVGDDAGTVDVTVCAVPCDVGVTGVNGEILEAGAVVAVVTAGDESVDNVVSEGNDVMVEPVACTVVG